MLKLPATFDSFRSRSDGSYGLSFSTQEATEADLGMLHKHNRLFGWLLFSENDINDDDIPPEEPVRDKDALSQSQRLRKSMFAWYMRIKAKVGIEEPFTTWNERQMEKIIQMVHDKIDDV